MKSCVLCESRIYRELFSVGDYKIARCKKCGLVKTIGKQKVKYEDYHRDKDYESHEKIFKNIFTKRYNLISKHFKKPGRILDIGAATGILLSVFKGNGWEVWGVEPSGSSEVIRERGFKVLKSQFEKTLLRKNYFDVVVLNHTLEHLKNPTKVLKRVKTILKKNGIVYIDVPNFESLSSRLYRQKWPYLLLEEHVHHFTPNTLEKIFKKSGFRVVWWRTWSGYFDVANPLFHIWYELTSFKPHLYKHLIFDLAGIPGSIIATAINKGTSLVMIGKKN